MRSEPVPLPPVVILGGDANALSVARCLGRRGVRVFTLNDHEAPVRHSRYCRLLPVPWMGSMEASWAGYVLGPDAEWLRGSVLLACCDEALELIAHNRARLSERFLLDESNPDAQLAMLNKLATYEAARAAGVPTPRFWVTGAGRSLRDLEPELVYPLLVKPLYSHRFAGRFGGKKFFVAGNVDELREGVETAGSAALEVMLVEQIPGPDDRLCSYYTYLDRDGTPQFDFTKRIIRRFPVGMGNGCAHITDRNPEVKEVALRLFRHVGLRGLANAEFKRDDRDGTLKLIECNARFTAANCLVASSGLDLAAFVYNRLVGLPPPATDRYRTGVRLWYPTQDFRAYLELRRRKQLSLWGWLRSIAHRQTLPYFRWSDPLPSVMRFLRSLKVDIAYVRTRQFLRGAVARCFSWRRAGATPSPQREGTIQ
jgi:predicted ATP-grasp superfamily ATP-dependent carboligase